MVTLDEKAWMRAWAQASQTGSADLEAVSAGADPSSEAHPTEIDGGGARVTCAFCGSEFVEDRSQATCQACPLSKACGLMRCPSCGYENPKQPAWISRLKEWIG